MNKYITVLIVCVTNDPLIHDSNRVYLNTVCRSSNVNDPNVQQQDRPDDFVTGD